METAFLSVSWNDKNSWEEQLIIYSILYKLLENNVFQKRRYADKK